MSRQQKLPVPIIGFVRGAAQRLRSESNAK